MYNFLSDNMHIIVTGVLCFLIGCYLYSSIRRFRKHRKPLKEKPVTQQIKQSGTERLGALLVCTLAIIMLSVISVALTDVGLMIMNGDIPYIFTNVKLLYKIFSWFISVTFIGVGGIFAWLSIAIFFYEIEYFIISPKLEFNEPDLKKRIDTLVKEREEKEKEEGWREV